MDKILTEISAGELLDKISILEIKIEKIKNPELKKQAKKEFETLNSNKEKSIKMTPDIEKLYLKLKETNLKLWKIEDEIRACEKNSDFKENFIKGQNNQNFRFFSKKRKVYRSSNDSTGRLKRPQNKLDAPFESPDVVLQN